MEVPGPCRCCLAEGLHKDLKAPYMYLDKKEIYSDMLLECFNIVLLQSEIATNTICDDCIKILRASLFFKHQVLEAEEYLLRSQRNLAPEYKPEVEVKVEPKYDSDDSDDYFLADAVRAVREVSVDRIKTEVQEKSEQKRRIKKKKGEEDWKRGGIKSLVSRLASSINCEIPSTLKKRQSKKHTITITQETPKITWNKANQKYKQVENLQNVLKYSNVMPFKNKSLLGFICAYCDAAYSDPENLRMHTEEDHKKERLNLKTKTDMTGFNVKLDITNLTCTLCDEKIENLNVLRDHLVRIHKKTIHSDVKDLLLQFKLKAGDVYDCAMCPSTYETFKMLKQHMNKHYSNFQCSECEAGFATKRSLLAHLTTHQEGSYKCEQCDKVFPSRSKKLYHVKMKHLGTRNISNCPFCDQPFRSYYQRNQHLIKVHNNEAKYKCKVCARSFILKSLLMYHIKKNHLMERNAQCTECGFRFFSKKALKAHMVKHTGERNYACEVCHKTYARKYTLREHMRIHNNDRRFKCDICGTSFVQKCSLKSHLLSNHGISLAASDITCRLSPISS